METEQHIYFFESIDTVSQACHLFPIIRWYIYTAGGCICGTSAARRWISKGATVPSSDVTAIRTSTPSRNCTSLVGFCSSLFREFLCEFYHTLSPSDRKSSTTELSALHRLPPTSETESLFRSWIPYMREGREISETVLRLKMTEAVYALLNTDKRYIPTLFDFAGKCRMDMFDLLNKPMTKEIKWQELQFEPDSKLN